MNDVVLVTEVHGYYIVSSLGFVLFCTYFLNEMCVYHHLQIDISNQLRVLMLWYNNELCCNVLNVQY